MGRDKQKMSGYHSRWNAEHTKLVSLRLTAATDGDMIEYLGKMENVAGYIRQLIRADMEGKSVKKFRYVLSEMSDADLEGFWADYDFNKVPAITEKTLRQDIENFESMITDENGGIPPMTHEEVVAYFMDRVEEDRGSHMIYFLVTEEGDIFQSCFSFDLEETRRKAEMEIAHLTPNEKKLATAYIEGYTIPVRDGSAEEQWNDYCRGRFEPGDPEFVETIL